MAPRPPSAAAPLKQVGQPLRDISELAQQIIAGANEGVIVYDRNLRYLAWNPWMERISGVRAEELLGRQPLEVFPFLKEQGVMELLERALQGESVVSADLPYTTAQGEVVWTAGRCSPLRDAQGEIGGVIVTLCDVTERRQAQEALRTSELHFRAIFQQAPLGIALLDSHTGQFLQINPRYCEIVERSEQEMLQRDFQTITHPDDLQADLDNMEQLRAGKIRSFTMEKRYVRPEGFLVWVQLTVVPLWPEGAPSSYHMAMVEDITTRKAGEEIVRRERDFSDALIQSLPGLFYLFDASRRPMRWNAKFERVSGYSAAEISRMHVLDFIAEEDRSAVGERIQQVFERGAGHAEACFLTKNGTRIPYYFTGTRVEVEGRLCFLGIGLDMTEQLRAQEALRASEERFRVALKNSPVVVFNQDRDLRYTWIHNPMLAWAETDPLGKTDAELIGPGDAAHLTQIKRRVLETGLGAHEEVELSFQGRQHCFDLTVEPLRDPAGKITGVTCACSNITGPRESSKRLQMLLELNHVLVSKLEFKRLFPALSSSLQPVLHQDFLSVVLYEADRHAVRAVSLECDLLGNLEDADLSVPAEKSLAFRALKKREICFYSRADLENADYNLVRRLLGAGIQCLCCIPLEAAGKPLGTLVLGSLQENGFGATDTELLWQVGAQVSLALDNARSYREIAELKDKLAQEKVYLENEIRSEGCFEEIIGQDRALKQALAQATTVAHTDATVLVLGETGTGKELVARAIHRMSPRSGNSFIKLNCAAIPTGLLESELFGHEKGAFTGAVSQKVGRVELADKGTLFLDEIGDLALELQPKLLRVLQDKEFERLGSNRTSRVDIRLIAATHEDLSKASRERRFRPDLFYRLSVFPIRLPPLRERREDIPPLVRYFTQKYAARMNKKIEKIPADSIAALKKWEWPGNIRELENFIERSVILTPGSVLRLPLSELRPEYETAPAGSTTLEATEREHILRILRECRGLISGPHGAAARLGMKRTTLQSKIRRMGITGYKSA